MKHKRYLLFTFSEHYPEGGLNDIEAQFDTVEEFKTYQEQKEPIWLQIWQLYDRIEGVIVEEAKYEEDPYDDEE